MGIHRWDLWKYRVDLILIDRVGLDMDSMEDYCWRQMFDEGMLPKEAAEEFMSDVLGMEV